MAICIQWLGVHLKSHVFLAPLIVWWDIECKFYSDMTWFETHTICLYRSNTGFVWKKWSTFSPNFSLKFVKWNEGRILWIKWQHWIHILTCKNMFYLLLKKCWKLYLLQIPVKEMDHRTWLHWTQATLAHVVFSLHGFCLVITAGCQVIKRS